MHTEHIHAHHPDCTCHASEGPGRSLARRMRLVGKLLRHDLRTSLNSRPDPTRGDLKRAAASIDERMAAAVTPEELATTLATLDKIAEAFGGRDALPLRSHGRGKGGCGRGSHGHRGRRHGGHRHEGHWADHHNHDRSYHAA